MRRFACVLNAAPLKRYVRYGVTEHSGRRFCEARASATPPMLQECMLSFAAGPRFAFLAFWIAPCIFCTPETALRRPPLPASQPFVQHRAWQRPRSRPGKLRGSQFTIRRSKG